MTEMPKRIWGERHPFWDWRIDAFVSEAAAKDEYGRSKAIPYLRQDIADELAAALRRLTLMARTSGGTAGPDAGLMSACEEAEAALARAQQEGEP